MVATRNGVPIPVDSNFYNVIYGSGTLPTPDQFQAIPLTGTSFYLTLPAPPINKDAIALLLPPDGTPPRFDDLVPAMRAALSKDPFFPAGTDISTLTPDQCTRMAYDIVWSLQNTLPLPPDPLEQLYTNPPNSGGGGGSSSNDEQDRQKFEGTIKSFYSTRNSDAVRLAKFVAAASGALYCELKSVNAGQALLEFPVDPATLTQTVAPVASEVLLTGLSSTGINFGVPAAYFYVVGAHLDKTTPGETRYQIACGDTAPRLLHEFGLAVTAGVIGTTTDDSERYAYPLPVPPATNNNPSITAAQAVRRLAALSVSSAVTVPPLPLPASPTDPLVLLIQAWLAATTAQPSYQTYQPTQDNSIWATIAAAQPAGFLELVLDALTQGYIVPASGGNPSAPLTQLITNFLTTLTANPDVDTLKNVTADQWTSFFTTPPADPSWLPPFTQPGNVAPTNQPLQKGYIATRIKAFVRAVQKFFTVSSLVNTASMPTPGAPPSFDLPPFDAITQAVVNLPSGFLFGKGSLSPSDLDNAVAGIFSPGTNAKAEAWLRQTIATINELAQIASVVPEITPNDVPVPGSLQFSIIEALYARGFRSAKDITALTGDDFQQAMTGTVAYANANSASNSLYQAAQGIAPNTPSTSSGDGGFQPINDGTLVDCIPPACLSPLGPVAYLQELLQLRQEFTCDNFGTLQQTGQSPPLADAIAARRGPVGNLLASCVNLETPLPLIDIVNECLENVASAPGTPVGAIYDTDLSKLTGLPASCQPEAGEPMEPCPEAAELLCASPQWSSPAAPVKNPAAYAALASDFSTPCLPYSQPIDMNRTYLDLLGSCRFEVMRHFRKEITEFTLDPTLAAPTFQSHLWRLPVKIDTAIEYLCITPQEYQQLFTQDIVDVPGNAGNLVLSELYGFPAGSTRGTEWISELLLLPVFLKRTGLTYCQLAELQKAGCFPFVVEPAFTDNQQQPGSGTLPDCEPCCLELYRVRFTGQEDQALPLKALAIFLRLWRKLDCICGGRYTFPELCAVIAVLHLFNGTVVNTDFIRQLAAFQMLLDQFHLDARKGSSAATSETSDRIRMLMLWMTDAATNSPAEWEWAVAHLLHGIEQYAQKRHACRDREPEFVKLLAGNLDQLSILAGFDPANPADTWYARPTNTLRFAEVLAKIYASPFGVGEIVYLFTASDHLDGDDPFPLQDPNESQDKPLGLPEDDEGHSLWALRKKLLAAQVPEEETREWSWRRIEAALRQEFGYQQATGEPDYLLSLGQHFFPTILGHAGVAVGPQDRQYRVNVAAPSPDMWNIPPDGPFRFDGTTGELWTELPLRDKAVVDKLEHLRPLNNDEQLAVQNLYYLPRLDLAPFALLFPNLAAAERHLIEEPDENERWEWFRRHFALAYRRCRIIAEHLACHVRSATGSEGHHGEQAAWLLLKDLLADENKAQTSWEDDSGVRPKVTWTPLPSGSSFAALLGLAGTGLFTEFSRADGAVAWREVSGRLSAFGHERDQDNAPLPTVIPAMGLTLTPEQMKYVDIRNGFAIRDQDGKELGGAESFTVRWTGILLVDEEGKYEFAAGAPTKEGEEPDNERAEHGRWRLTLSRGQKSWVVLSHRWQGEKGRVESSLALRCGAYGIVAEYVQSSPEFAGVDDIYPQHTGFQVKYAGPDTGGKMATVPLSRLYRATEDDTLDVPAIELPENSAAEKFLKLHYTSTLRDIRRTYQRAFKAMLFSQRFQLSGHRLATYRQSELGYLLDHGDLFAGVSYYRNPAAFTRHAANLDFNFLPLLDHYLPPPQSQDQRVQPQPKREQALFDWWERIFDYCRMRADRQKAVERPVWLLFEEALEKQPDEPAQLLRHLDVDLRHAPLVLSYFQGEQSPVYAVSSTDLQDDRWAIRAWHGDRWARRLQCCLQPIGMTSARPDLWVSDDPSSLLPNEKKSGNENLVTFIDTLFLTAVPDRHADLKCVNDRLRERARKALLEYLCTMDRVPIPGTTGAFAQAPNELSGILLLDVQAGLCEKASRIDEAISAVQSFIRRAMLGLEPGWPVSRGFAELWERRFANFRTWESCKRRDLYRENWVDWDEIAQARRVEAFRFLESEVRSATLTVAQPGGGEWWPDQRPRRHDPLLALQERVPSTIAEIAAAPPTPEGWAILGTPERDARPSWLAAPVLTNSTAPQPGPGQPGGQPGQPGGQPGQPGGQPGQPGQPGGQTGQPQFEPRLAVLASQAAQGALPTNLPFWLETAIRLGTRFVRVAAAGEPAGSAEFQADPAKKSKGCCTECGKNHPPLVDEYYFWLIDAEIYQEPGDGTDAGNQNGYQFGFQDAFYDNTQQQSVSWNDPSQLPPLLHWPAQPAVRLAWCRVHNGQFGQPRRSTTRVAIDPNASSLPEIRYLGRERDSLYFSVTSAAPPASGVTDTSLAGFRYDLPTDEAVALPLEVPAVKPAGPPLPGGLPAYPYFAYDTPGDRLFPNSLFAPALVVAEALRLRCRYDLALKWYELAFAPLSGDCTWINCGGTVVTGGQPQIRDIGRTGAAAGEGSFYGGACCDSTAIGDDAVRHRAITLHYCDTLLEWGKHLMRHRPNPEAFQQARLLFDTAARIMGKQPATVVQEEQGAPQPVATFQQAIPPLNPRLIELYDRCCDSLQLVRECQDAERLRNGRVGCDMPYFGNSLTSGCGTLDPCVEETEWCLPHSPYRFLFLIQKANELAAGVREFGSALLAAYEKGDAEYLASLRAEHEREMQELQLAVRQDQWRDADWQLQALQQSKDMNQTNLIYFTNLYNNGLINDEIQNQTLANTAMQTRTGANTVNAVGQAMKVIPDLFIGFPCNDSQVPIGTKLAGVFETIAAVMNVFADLQKATAELDLTLAGWQRRSDEWLHQMQTLPIEIEQIELQILGAQRRRDQALKDLNNQQRQIEQSTEALNFLRDKFTDDALYLWMQKETFALYGKMYELALHAARQAELAFNFERGHTRRRFIPECSWDNLYEGLLAGERLEYALRRMEKAYLDLNVREHELTKHISLRLQFPAAFLRLRSTGCCEIEVPEWMFDQDYPGHYMRRIKNLSVTIPCVTGPYTGVHCRLTVVSSMTRIDPSCSPPAHHCCRDRKDRCDYEACPEDPRVVREYAARESIATSNGQNDSGMFQLDFKDDRYLPFEYLGAVCRIRIEMPPENNYFDLDSLTDFIIHMNYTSREGGERLREAARECARRKLPGDGWIFLDLRRDFPDAWELYRRQRKEEKGERSMKVRIGRRLFPFIPCNPAIRVTDVAVLFEADEGCKEPRREICGCPCHCEEVGCNKLVEVTVDRKDDDREDFGEVEIPCVPAAEWPHLYHGIGKVGIGPIDRCHEHHTLTLTFREECLEDVYLLCRYEEIKECCEER